MKNRFIKIAALSFATFCGAILSSCNNTQDEEPNSNDIEIVTSDDQTHYLSFYENNSMILKMIVFKGETYEDLKPYFPTLTKKEGYICYWDGDYEYTDYTHENRFKVFDEEKFNISVYAYMKKM